MRSIKMISKPTKYFSLAGIVVALIIAGESYLSESTKYHPTRHPEVTKGQIVNYSEEQESEEDKIIRFEIRYVTGERVPCARLLKANGEMWGDCSYIGSANTRRVENPLPLEQNIEICCIDGRFGPRCSIPGDSGYERCLIDVKRYENNGR